MESLSPWLAPLGLLAAALIVTAAASAALHAILHQRDHRSASGWLGLILVFPLVGAILYWIFGINRIRRRARSLREGAAPSPAAARATLSDRIPPVTRRAAIPPSRSAGLAYSVGSVVGVPLVGGNDVEVLVDGDEAYPTMLAEIAAAERSVGLSTYIFDADRSGREFVDALAEARARGVEVRVLVDAVGTMYSWPPITTLLSRRGVPTARFLRAVPPFGLPTINLRTHRKILTVDGRTAFVGGMNIREGHRIERAPKHRVRDLHFRLRGPVVARVQQVLAGDWLFTTGERLEGEAWWPEDLASPGATLARVISDGPDEDLDKARWALLGALGAARDSIRVVTPYFLPDADLVTALGLAARRGVEVRILLPAENNLPYMHWAMASHAQQVLEHGCEVHLSEGPFDHSKLLLVDSDWAFVGSANWDPRSLRLNFEINVELYDAELGRNLGAIVDAKLERSHPLRLEDLETRPFWKRLRDGVARLGQPYL